MIRYWYAHITLSRSDAATLWLEKTVEELARTIHKPFLLRPSSRSASSIRSNFLPSATTFLLPTLPSPAVTTRDQEGSYSDLL